MLAERAPDSFATSMCSRVRTLDDWARTARASHGQAVKPMTSARIVGLRLCNATLTKMITISVGIASAMLVRPLSRSSIRPPT